MDVRVEIFDESLVKLISLFGYKNLVGRISPTNVPKIGPCL
jgi:hypothetical protein